MSITLELSNAGTALKLALAAVEEERAKTYEVIVKANEAGVSKTKIAALTGVSRQTVYKIIDESRK